MSPTVLSIPIPECVAPPRRIPRSVVSGFWAHAALMVLFGCGTNEERAAGIRDDLGRMVEITGTPERIVSLSPAITEILFALDVDHRLVGRTQWDVYPPEAVGVPNVGEGMPPNVEAVAAVDPDLVIFYASDANRQAMAQLAALGVTSFSVRVDLLRGLPNVIRALGTVTGSASRADQIAAAFQDRLDSTMAVPNQSAEPVRVMILTWDNPPIVIGGESFLNELVEMAGAENIFSDIDAPSASVSIETVADRDPDVLLITTGSRVPSYASRSEWKVLRAVAEGRFAFVEGTEFEWPTTRSLDAVPRVRRALLDAARRPVPVGVR